MTVQQQELPAFKELGQYIQSTGNTQQSHKGKDDGDRLCVLHNEDAAEEGNLEKSVTVDSTLVDVLGVRCRRVSAGLLEEQEEAIPELDARHGGETHEQKDSKEDREGDLLDGGKEQKRETNQSVGNEVCQACLLYLDDVAILVSVGQVIQVNDARDGGSHEPRETQETVDQIAKAIAQEVPIVGVSVLQVVTGVVDQMPCDSVIKVEEEKGKDGRTGSDEHRPGLSIEITHLGKPRTGTGWSIRNGSSTFVWPKGITRGVTAREGRLKVVGNLELFGFHVIETDLLHDRPQDDRAGDRKVMDEITGILVAEVA